MRRIEPNTCINFRWIQIYHTHSSATTIIDTQKHVLFDVLYTHLKALICQIKNGGWGPITYQIISLYYDGIRIHKENFNNEKWLLQLFRLPSISWVITFYIISDT